MSWPSGAIWCDGNVGTPLERSDQSSQGLCSPTGGGPSHKIDWKKSCGTTYQFPIPVTTDHYGDPSFPDQIGHHQQSAVPESDNHPFSIIVFEKRLQDLGVDIFDPQGKSIEVEQSIGEKGNQKEDDPLAQFSKKASSSLGHFLFFILFFADRRPPKVER